MMALSTLSVALMLSICGCFSTAQAVAVTLQSSSSMAIVRGTFSFTCTSQEIAEVQEFKWFHNQTELTSDVIQLRNGRFSIRESGSTSSILSVRSAERQDGGEYYCQAIIPGSANPVNSSQHNIKIQGIFSITTDEPIYEAVLGSRVEVRCTVDADPPTSTITWRRRESTNPLISQSSVEPTFGILQKNVTLEDNGEWICHTSGQFGGADVGFTIVVLVPPSNTNITQRTSTPILRDQDFQLECNADGNRAPNFTWTFNRTTNFTGPSRMPNSGYTLDSSRGQVLTVRKATYRDAGNYTCTATNKAGVDSTSISIEVEGAPEIIVGQSTSQIRVGNHSGIHLDCPFISNPPPTSVEWSKGSTPVTSGDNGTLHIESFESTGTINFTCNISNQHGSDSRTFNLLVQDFPAPPTNFSFEQHLNDTRAITVTWTGSVQNGPVNEVEDYVVEQTINGGEFHQSEHVFNKNATSGVLSGLLPGVTYVFRLSARNVAGLSQPSNSLTYTPPATSPMLSFFTVSALNGGRSVLLEWELAFDGGHEVTEFKVEIMSDDLVLTIPLNISLGKHVVTGLKHDTHYEFRAVVVNAASRTANFTIETNTTVAPPSQPTKPIIALKTISSITISFSVEFGTEPITHFLLNITGTISGTEIQKRFPISAVKYIDSLKEIVNNEGVVIGYNVEVVVTGLRDREVYQFEIAAESSIGVGEFSELSDNAKLDRILYFIIGGVVVGMLAIVIPIVVMGLFCYGKQRYNQRKKTITINSNGSHAFTSEDIDNAFTKATTPSVRQHSRETLTSTTNSYFGNGHIHSNIIKQESYDREKAVVSPPYNRLGESPIPSGVSIGIKTDSVIDMPAENGTVVQTYFAGGKVAYNPQYNHHVPAQYSPRPQHMQLQLQTSFNDLQCQMESPSPPEKYRETPMSEKQFLSNSHNMLSIPGTNLSRSNPTISNRHSCDSMLLPPGPTSQATDV